MTFAAKLESPAILMTSHSVLLSIEQMHTQKPTNMMQATSEVYEVREFFPFQILMTNWSNACIAPKKLADRSLGRDAENSRIRPDCLIKIKSTCSPLQRIERFLDEKLATSTTRRQIIEIGTHRTADMELRYTKTFVDIWERSWKWWKSSSQYWKAT